MRNKKLQVNKTMWIERHKHETIVRKYREKIHRISEDYDMKIMIQSRRINILMKTIKQQKDLIDEFMLKSKPIDDDSPTEDDLDSDFDFDLKNHGNADAENNEFHVDEIKSDPVDQNGEQNNSNEIIHGTEHESTHVADISDKGDANEVLFAIDIQPGVKESKENSTDFVCQLCNKLFSSSRVLSVRMKYSKRLKRLSSARVKAFNSILFSSSFLIYRNTSEQFITR